MCIYSNTNHRKNLIKYWRQYNPLYEIPKGFHVHHITPRSIAKQQGWGDAKINHPKNLVALHPDDHISIHKNRGDHFIHSNFLQLIGFNKNGCTIEGAAKAVITKRNIINNEGLDIFQQASKKMVSTRRNTIGDDGLNIIQRASIKRKQTMFENINNHGENKFQEAARKSSIKRRIINDSGLNSYQEAAKKMTRTRKNIVNNNGKNSFEHGAIKGANTKKITLDENGYNLYEQMVHHAKNDVDENGLDTYQRGILKRLGKCYLYGHVKHGEFSTPHELASLIGLSASKISKGSKNNFNDVITKNSFVQCKYLQELSYNPVGLTWHDTGLYSVTIFS